ncbi:pentatricopeptide repeat-containing protein At2g29760, chloroplastic-like [Cornus florida]|uniref:pentatricopeptide repeat-containing protein At2g29760, chloroplastic-like n=1 Tax=Cornus florida TaxID=4283 RepID=UPI00289DCAEB|nr:pentatricopeptide repeat-containing protein At2g29760, chloroplastic-like [Cornus florida]
MEQKLHYFLQNCRSIRQLKQTHLQILINGLQDCNFILPKLINLSSDLISLDYATDVFQSSCTPKVNVIAYNTMIKCFTGKSHRGALRTYNQMKVALISPNSFTITFLLRCIESLAALKDGTVVHGDTVKLGFGSSAFVQNTLLDFYAKCRESLDSACLVFDEMPQRDVVSWNTMIGAYMARGMIESSIQLFDRMPERSTVTWNSVIGGLAKAGNMDLAHSFFRSMPVRNEVSWNSMISGYIRVGDVKTARSIFDQMPEKTVVSWTAMISGYTTIGDLESARAFFDQMPVKNVVSWNAMIACYVHNHRFDEALSVLHHMLIDGVCRPDQTTLVSVLSACAHLGSLEHGKWIDSYIKKNKINLSNPLGNALIDMFAKCGDVENGRAVFDRMAKRCIITWTAMVSGLAVNGQCREALALFDRMCLEGIKPDDVFFIAVLSACTHGGLVEEGRRVFDQMVSEFGIEPCIEHYGCMVDLLARAGKLEEAIRFIESMHMEPNTIIWATLLGACKIHGNGELLESVPRKIMNQEPSNPSYLMLFTNLSSSVGRWEDALNFRVAMRHRGVDKVPGCSSIQIGNNVHEFLAKDTKHEQRKEIYRVLDSLNGQLKTIYDVW